MARGVAAAEGVAVVVLRGVAGTVPPAPWQATHTLVVITVLAHILPSMQESYVLILCALEFQQQQ